jgi:hypothetical protein
MVVTFGAYFVSKMLMPTQDFILLANWGVKRIEVGNQFLNAKCSLVDY